MTNPTKKRKTAPGFYEPHFLPHELRDLNYLFDGGLQNEIDLIRVANRRYLEYAKSADSLKEAGEVLTTLAQTAVRISQLVRAQEAISKKAENALDAIAQAIQELLDDWKLNQGV